MQWGCPAWVAGAALGVVLLQSGCKAPAVVTVEAPVLDARARAEAVKAIAQAQSGWRAQTNRLTLADAVAHALRSDPGLQLEAAKIRRRSADALADLTFDSPELRFGWDWGNQDGSETWEATERGSRTERESSTTLSRREELFDFPQQSMRGESGSSRSRFSSQGSGSSVSAESRDGMDLGLRFQPPNPWQWRADRDVRDAEAHAGTCGLQQERQELICDIVEAAVELAYHRRMLAVERGLEARSREFQARAAALAGAGAITEADGVDARLQLQDALGRVAKRRGDIRRLEAAFTWLTGVEQSRVTLDGAQAGSIWVGPRDTNAPARVAQYRELARMRPDVMGALWLVRQAQGELRGATAKRYPWISFAEAGYETWQHDGTEEETRREQGQETTESSSASSELTTSVGSLSTEQRVTSGRSTETTSRTGSKTTVSDEEGDGWWVGVGVEIPVFEWLSRETKLRRGGLQEMNRAFEALYGRAEQEVMQAGEALREAQAALAVEQARVRGEVRELNAAAVRIAAEGFSGEQDALQVRERSALMTVQFMEEAMGVALAEVHFCRMAGLVPGRAGATAGDEREDAQ